jgi:hypothetical protein
VKDWPHETCRYLLYYGLGAWRQGHCGYIRGDFLGTPEEHPILLLFKRHAIANLASDSMLRLGRLITTDCNADYSALRPPLKGAVTGKPDRAHGRSNVCV